MTCPGAGSGTGSAPPTGERIRQRLRRMPGFGGWVLLRQVVAGGEHREAAVARVLRPANLFQPWTTTARDRYPDELALVRSLLATEATRVLSFGCASGEELLTLHHDFPQARVRGIEINPLAVRTARRRIRAAGAEGRVAVVRAGDASGEPAASYDVVLALAVFRHGSLNAGPPRCDHLIRFADFERTVTGLARAVRPGALLVLRHANFRFADCAVAAEFEPVGPRFESASEHGPTPVYGPDDTLADPGSRDDGVYRRLGGQASGLSARG